VDDDDASFILTHAPSAFAFIVVFVLVIHIYFVVFIRGVVWVILGRGGDTPSITMFYLSCAVALSKVLLID
jgi:hypothetical protein